MLLQYQKQIITVLIYLLLWMPVAGLQAQIVDISKVNSATNSLAPLNIDIDIDSRQKQHVYSSERHSNDNCSAHPMGQTDNNCVSDGEACQYDNNCCGAKLLSILEYSTRIFYHTDGFLTVAKSQSVPLLILPTEIKPPRPFQ